MNPTVARLVGGGDYGFLNSADSFTRSRAPNLNSRLRRCPGACTRSDLQANLPRANLVIRPKESPNAPSASARGGSAASAVAVSDAVAAPRLVHEAGDQDEVQHRQGDRHADARIGSTTGTSRRKRAGRSRCTGSCLKKWPPGYTSTGAVPKHVAGGDGNLRNRQARHQAPADRQRPARVQLQGRQGRRRQVRRSRRLARRTADVEARRGAP